MFNGRESGSQKCRLLPRQWLTPNIVWKRYFPHSSVPPSFANLNTKRQNDIEWISDLFRASVLSENASFSQLRMCQLSYKQTHILATLVPDEIIHSKDLRNKSMISFVGVLLFADVSGFTALCEKYSASGKGGTYRLTTTLNSYIGSMVEVIYSHGGDVLNFAGDAFLALWKVKHDDYISHIIHNAIACALFIQEVLGSYDTDVKVLLKVKIAISTGNILFSIIGDELSQQFIVCGTPIEDVNAAERLCMSGDVILSPSAWGHCSSHNYEFISREKGHVKMVRIIYNPKIIRKDILRRFTPLSVMLESRKEMAEDNATIVQVASASILTDSNVKQNVHHSVLRPSVAEACKEKIGGMLRPFIIPPVVQQIDADQPLQYLTEMRQVTTLFINIVPQKVSTNALVSVVDEVYVTIFKIVRTALGCVNKVTMFDKDITFLVIFGLRGCKYESESENGLKCAYSVLQAIRDIKSILSISAGVTTGMVYCGVVGHSIRREYTVIGAPVNKAARLMCAYPGQVTCDYITFVQSKLPLENFELQEVKKLKGIDTAGKVYKYADNKIDVIGIPRGKLTFVGREDVTKEFEGMLNQDQITFNSLVIKGDNQVGKSCLINELMKKSTPKFVPIFINLNNIHLTIPFFTMHYILKEMLDISDTSTLQDRTKCILNKMNGLISKRELCYLNEILQVKFPHSAQYLRNSQKNRTTTLARILQKFILQQPERYIIAIDDAHFTDSQSWELLTSLVLSNSIFLIITMSDSHRAIITEEAQLFLSCDKVKVLNLRGLEPIQILSLACQFLNVRAISDELECYLKKYGLGNPGWCISFLTSLIHTGSLQYQEMTMDEIEQNNLVISDYSEHNMSNEECMDTAVQCLDTARQSIEETYSGQQLPLSVKKTVPVCIINPNYYIKKDAIPQTIDAMIMTIFDSLTPYEQLLVKCSSVLGDTFTRNMLIAVMHNPSSHKTAEAVKRLFELQVLDCILTYSRTMSERGLSIVKAHMEDSLINCFCPENKGEQLRKIFPKYAFCQALHFKISLFRITTYELLPTNQKKYFHERAVQFLENNYNKCVSCGGKGLFVSSLQNVEDEVSIPPRPDQKMANMKNDDVLNGKELYCAGKGDSEETESDSASSINKITKQESDSFYIDELNIKNFQNCECFFVNFHTCQQLVHHSAAAGLKQKQIKFLTQQGEISIMIGNNMQAIKLLNKSKLLIENDTKEETSLANIHMLLGQANLDMGNLNEAKMHLLLSIHKYKILFPKSKILAQLTFIPWQYFRLLCHQRHPRIRGRTFYYNEKATTFLHLTNVYMIEQKWLKAELSALMSLNLALRANNFSGLCESYSNMMEICHHLKRLRYNKKLERTALSTIKTHYSGSEAKELQSVCHLYWATTVSRLLRGELESSVEIGLKTKKMSENLHNNFITLTILPTLIQVLIINGRLHQAVDLLQVLLFEAQTDVDKSSEIWYYALCFDILLDTGVTIQTAKTCILYGQQLLNKYKEKIGNTVYRDKSSIHRFATCMWIWYIRMNNESQCHVWGNIVTHLIQKEDTFSDLITALRYLEGLLVCTVIELNISSEHILQFNTQAESLMSKLETIAENVTIIQPRLFHLKGYFLCIRNNKPKANEILNKAKKRAEYQKNFLEIGWITHNLNMWNGKISSMDVHLWEEVVFEAGLRWHEYKDQSPPKVSYYLPTPKQTDI